MKKIITLPILEACRFDLLKKMLLTGILLTNVLIASFSQRTSVLLSSYDSCHVQPPQQQTSFVLKAAGSAPMLRVAYVIPSNRTPQPDGVANLQHAIKEGQQFFKEQMEQNGFGAKTYIFETEADGVTPLIHLVPVTETDEYLRADIWNRTQQAATNAGISLWAQGEVWVVIPEAHLMQPDGVVTGGVALGASSGAGNSPGVSMIGSNALPLLPPGVITDDTPYDGKVLPALGPYPMKQDVTFASFEGSTFSSLASSWLGALWHETGHAFGLPHDFRNDNNFHGNLMGNGLRGARGSLFPEKYPQDYTRLEYASALILNVSHYFNKDNMVTPSPVLSYANPGSVIPQQGLVHFSFQASDADSLSFAHLRYRGDMVAEILLHGTKADTAFAVPYFAQGEINEYTIAVHDKQGNTTFTGFKLNVPGGNNQAPISFIKINPAVPASNQSITLDATQSSDVDNDQSSILATWDVDNDGQFDTEPSTNKTVQYQYKNPGNYLIRLKLTDPAGAQTVSTAVSIKIPGEKKITVESFTLIDADKDEAVSVLQDGLIIAQTAWKGKTFSVRANTSAGMIDQVEFSLKGPIAYEQVDREPPYALFGDTPAGNFIGRELLQGEYTLTATPFFGSEKGIALTVSFKVIPGPPSIVRDRTLGGMGTEWLRGVASTSDGGFLLAGRSSSNTSGDKSENSRGEDDYWIVKINAQHNKEWDKTFGGDKSEDLYSVVLSSDGGYLLGGSSVSDISGDKTSPNKGLSDYWVLKINKEGNKVWDRTFGGDAHELLSSMIPISDGGYLLAGFSESNISGDKSAPSKGSADYWVVKIDSEGNKIWDKTFGGSLQDELRSITSTADGYLLAGFSESNISGDKSAPSKGSFDYWVVKIDKQGNKVWDKTFGGNAYDEFSSAIAVPDGSYLLTGSSSSDLSGDKSEGSKGFADFWVVKIDADGNKTWDKTFGGKSHEFITTAVTAPGGGYLLSGTSSSDISGDKSENSVGEDDLENDYWVLKIDAQGNKVWDKTLGGSDFDNYPNGILAPDNSYLLAGYSRSNTSGDKSEDSKGDYDYWIIELELPIVDQVCAGDVMLASQAEVDAFNCSRVTGNLTVTGADITNLNGLSSLTQVYGNLRIENVNVTDLNSLALLDSIGGALLVLNNSSLTHIQGISFSITEGIEISNNNNLLRIEGFNTLHKLGWLGFQNNPKLTSVVGFNSVEIIQTASASPFAPTGIGISNNGALITIPGFQMLSRVGQITITGNNQLYSLDGFSNVSRIEGVLTIRDNSSLKVINAFSKLVSVVGISRQIPRAGLHIENNPLLEGFPGLSALKEVKSDQFAEIFITNNASLKNIDGLSSLTTFFTLHADKTLNIRNNAVLENVDGLSSIVNVPQGEGATYVNVTGNPKLTRCCGLKPLLDALSSNDPPSLHINISQNGGGCTLQDILACSLQKVLNFTLINYKTHEVIQNFQDEMTIDLADPKFSHLMLRANTAPRQVGSVEFVFDGDIRRIENHFPYEFILPQFTPGTHTVRAEVYSKHQKKGEKGVGRTATFKVINSATIISFDVVNRFGQTLMNLHDGDKININDPAFKHFRFRANTVPDQVGRIDLYLNNRLVAVEHHFPYEVYGNPTPGDYTLEAIPYVKTTGRHAVAGTPLKISFKIVSEKAISTSQLAVNDQQNVESFRQASEGVSVLIFPVPVDNELFVKIDDTAGKDAVLNILTIQGLSVYKGTYSKTSSISTADLKPGVYVLHVVGNNGFHRVVKFIKK